MRTSTEIPQGERGIHQIYTVHINISITSTQVTKQWFTEHLESKSMLSFT